MAELPVLKTRKLLRMLSLLGFEVVSQKGSHMKLKKSAGDKTRVVIVPNHDEIRRRTLQSIIRQTGLTREEFLKDAEEA